MLIYIFFVIGGICTSTARVAIATTSSDASAAATTATRGMDASTAVPPTPAAATDAAPTAAINGPANRLWVGSLSSSRHTFPSPILTISHRTNNPFAPALTASSSNASSAFSSPALQSSAPISFNLQGTYSNGNAPSTTSFTPPPQPPKSAPPGSGSMRNPTKADQDHAHLADLFANRDDGIDSFGNYGQLRCVLVRTA